MKLTRKQLRSIIEYSLNEAPKQDVFADNTDFDHREGEEKPTKQDISQFKTMGFNIKIEELTIGGGENSIKPGNYSVILNGDVYTIYDKKVFNITGEIPNMDPNIVVRYENLKLAGDVLNDYTTDRDNRIDVVMLLEAWIKKQKAAIRAANTYVKISCNYETAEITYNTPVYKILTNKGIRGERVMEVKLDASQRIRAGGKVPKVLEPTPPDHFIWYIFKKGKNKNIFGF